MTKLTEKRLQQKGNKMNPKFIIFAVGLLTLSLNIDHTHHFDGFENIKGKENDSMIIYREVNLAREFCEGRGFSFCNGGYDLPFRLYPVFVQLDTGDFMRSYSGEVYMFATGNIFDSLVREKISCMDSQTMDSLFSRYKGADNIVRFYNKRYKQRVVREIKRSKLNLDFDGYLKYEIFKVKFNCMYGGVQELVIPNIGGNNREGIFKRKYCKVYFITKIYNIEPSAR